MKKWLLLLALSCLAATPAPVKIMPWSGILAPSRATDWTTAGVQGGIPSASWPICNNAACLALDTGGAGSVTSATIASAMSGAQVGGVACAPVTNPCVVRIRAGNFTLNAGVTAVSGVVLRGMGASQTFFTATGVSGNCGYGGSYNSVIALCTGGGFGGGEPNWTAGYAVGTHQITLSNRAGLVAGRTYVHLNQTSDNGYPNSSGVWLCDSGPGTGCNGSGSGGGDFPGGVGHTGKMVAQDVLITGCVGGTCSGAGDVTISPPLSNPAFRSGRSNTAMYADSTLWWSGIEDFSIVTSNVGNTAIQIVNATNTWMRGIRIVNAGGASYGVVILRAAHIAVQDNYFYRTTSTEQGNYNMSLVGAGAVLIQNNIGQGSGATFGTTDNTFNHSVVAYNFTLSGSVGFIRHLGGENMILLEGNIVRNVWSDNADGMGCCITLFRNGLVGNRYTQGSEGNIHSAVTISAKHRMDNVVGNVIGDSSLWPTTYETHNTSGSDISPAVIYNLGGNSDNSYTVPFDALVSSTMFRWGNWDEITSTAPTIDNDQTGTRWCGSAANTNWAKCTAGTEVPSGLSFMPNPIPAMETIPASFYLSSKPAWFQSLAWPGIGPDVSGGTVTSMGGHVKLNPAANCYLNTMGGATNGSGGPYTFNRVTCYGSN